jgi:hypothetical protein
MRLCMHSYFCIANTTVGLSDLSLDSVPLYLSVSQKCSKPHENLHLYVFLCEECDGSIIFDGGRTAMRQISISTGESVIGTIQSEYRGKLYESLYTYVTLCGQHDSGIS